MSKPRVLQVYLDDDGGGPVHVELMRRALGDKVDWGALPLNPSAGKGATGTIRALRQIFVAGKQGPRIVHAHGVRAALLCQLAARRGKAPLVVTVHGLHSLRRSPTRRAVTLNRLALRKADAVLCLSRSDAEMVAGQRLASPDRVHHIRTAFESRRLPDRLTARTQFGISPDAFVVLWLGRFEEEQKDAMSFARAIATCGAENVVGLMLGNGPGLAQVRQFAGNPDLRGRLLVPGRLADPAPAIAAADTFVSTSRWEGLPLASLECGSAGMPLILSDVPGNRDIVDAGVPAILYSAGNAGALAAELTRIVADRDEARTLGARTKAAVDSAFTLEGLRDDLLFVYRAIWPN